MFSFDRERYAEQLDDCGKAFRGFLTENQKELEEVRNVDWTELVLDWFAATAPKDVLVDGRPNRAPSWRLGREHIGDMPADVRRHGEFLLDLTHSTYPRYADHKSFYSKKYWDAAVAQPCRVLLALESEWGKRIAREAALALVLEDAAKLAAVRAVAKVLVFASKTGAGAETDYIVDTVTKMRNMAGDDAPWLLIDIPWGSSDGAWKTTSTVVSGPPA